jgi:phosphatidylserine/phosphatidylglycerophosphate/cardiolipin synthase-like enzyme
LKTLNRSTLTFLLFAWALFVAVLPRPADAQSMSLAGCTATTAFSPHGGAADLVISTIASAKKSIRVAGYYFFDARVGKALLDARRRGVDVRIVLDKDHNAAKPGPSVASYLAGNGVAVSITSAYRIQHNKVLVIDGETVETGSYNYTKGADTENAENVLVIGNCPRLAMQYLRDWDKLQASASSRMSGGGN